MKSTRLLVLDNGLTCANAQPQTAGLHADGRGFADMRDPSERMAAPDGTAAEAADGVPVT